MKRILQISLFALTVLTSATAAGMRAPISPPPPPLVGMTARPGPGYVWMPGYYRWDGHRYYWVAGKWTVPPRGRRAWVPGRWVRRGGVHIWTEGRWR